MTEGSRKYKKKKQVDFG